MAEVRIPSAYRSPLIQLAEYDDSQIEELCSLLEKHPEVLTSRQTALDQAETLTKTKPEVGFNLLEAVIPLMYFRVSHAATLDEVVKDVTAALKTGDNQETKLAAPAVTKFQQNLRRFLALSSVALKAKALSIATDSQRLFSESKI